MKPATLRNYPGQPGWSMPIAVDYRNFSFLGWLLGRRDETRACLARRQGRCPGRDQCHDCAWSATSD